MESHYLRVAKLFGTHTNNSIREKNSGNCDLCATSWLRFTQNKNFGSAFGIIAAELWIWFLLWSFITQTPCFSLLLRSLVHGTGNFGARMCDGTAWKHDLLQRPTQKLNRNSGTRWTKCENMNSTSQRVIVKNGAKNKFYWQDLENCGRFPSGQKDIDP